ARKLFNLIWVLKENYRRRLQARADHLVPAFDFKRARHHAAQHANAFPFRQERIVGPLLWRLLEELQMHALLDAVARRPGFLHGEAQKRREPGDNVAEERVDDRARRTAAEALFRVAIENVLADVEIKCRQIGGGKIEQIREDVGEIIFAVALAHLAV